MSYVYEDDLIMCERKSKLDRVKKQIKLEKTLSYKIRKFFKGK